MRHESEWQVTMRSFVSAAALPTPISYPSNGLCVTTQPGFLEAMTQENCLLGSVGVIDYTFPGLTGTSSLSGPRWLFFPRVEKSVGTIKERDSRFGVTALLWCRRSIRWQQPCPGGSKAAMLLAPSSVTTHPALRFLYQWGVSGVSPNSCEWAPYTSPFLMLMPPLSRFSQLLM